MILGGTEKNFHKVKIFIWENDPPLKLEIYLVNFFGNSHNIFLLLASDPLPHR